jgi:hypothetical protein
MDLPQFFRERSVDLPSMGTARVFDRPSTSHQEQVKGFWPRYGGTLLALLAVLYFGALSALVVVFSFGLPDAARDARTLVRRGQAAQIVPQLERYVTGPKSPPTLASALGYAEVYAKKPQKALIAYQTAAEHEPAALEEADIAAVAGMLALSSDQTFDAEKVLKRVGDRARPWLEEIWGRDKVDRYIRCRAGDVLSSMGVAVDVVAACGHALERRRCGERKVIVRRLQEIGDPRAIPALEALAREKPILADDDCASHMASVAVGALKGKSRSR